MHQEITMRLSHLTAIAAVALGLGTGAALAGPDYPNNAPVAQPETLGTHQAREIRRVRVAPVTAVYPNNDPSPQLPVASSGRSGPVAPVTATYPNNPPNG